MVWPADAAVGPMVVALRRYGASLKDYPSLAKYDETIRVSDPLTGLWQNFNPGPLLREAESELPRLQR